MTNPYRWDTERPAHPLERDKFAKLAALLALGGRAMVHAGHGMGKSVLLGWLEDKLTAQGLRVLRLGAPEGQPLAEVLRGRLDPAAVDLRAAATRACGDRPTVLLIDELDAWVDGARAQPTCEALGVLGKLSQDELHGRLGVLVAGGLRQLLLTRTPWGSVFASRVEATEFLKPLSVAELATLAEPLRARRSDDDPTALDGWLAELQLASGGVPILAVRGLQQAWEAPLTAPLPRPTEALARWVAGQRTLRATVRSSVYVPEQTHAWALLERVRGAADGVVPLDELRALCPPASSPDELLALLVAAGLVHPDLDLSADPALVRENPSVLLPERAAVRGPPSALERLFADLEAACAELRLHRADLRAGAGAKRALVPEALFSAMLSMSLRARGWQTHREAQQGEGRTDLLVRGPRLDGHVIVEVKRWGNADLPQLAEQLGGYVSTDSGFTEGDTTRAVAAVIVAGPQLDPNAQADKLPWTNGATAAGAGALSTWRGSLPAAPDLQLLTVLVSDLFRAAYA